MNHQTLEDVVVTPATGAELEGGILAWCRARYGGLWIDGITVRKTRDGRIAIVFPARRDGAHRQHFYVQPADLATRRALEAAILAAFRTQR